MPVNKKELTQYIKAEAMRLGFSACGISSIVELEEEKHRLKSWLDKGYAADMHYMHNNFEKRINPQFLVDDAISVISVLLNYYPGELKHTKGQPRISKYALGRDYHKVLKNMLKALYQSIERKYPEIKGRFFVDSAPVMDKAWAAKSGLGWKGKNGNLINKKKGSFHFIGEIICNLELEEDKPVSSFCGQCTKCIDHCPTKAITEPYIVDANKCISYQTIEKKEAIDEAIVPQLNDFIFGCDICQDVCPWNNKSVLSEIADFGTKTELLNWTYQDYQNLSKTDFDNTFNGTPVKRAGYEKIQKTIAQILNHKKNQNSM
jgi:epoxyqueuosine reductase